MEDSFQMRVYEGDSKGEFVVSEKACKNTITKGWTASDFMKDNQEKDSRRAAQTARICGSISRNLEFLG
jgi:hypothetical protein